MHNIHAGGITKYGNLTLHISRKKMDQNRTSDFIKNYVYITLHVDLSVEK